MRISIARITSLLLLSSLLLTKISSAQQGEWILLDSLENMQYWSLDCFDPMNCAVTGDSTGWNWFVRITDDGWKTSRIIILDSLRPPDPHSLIRFEHVSYPAVDRLLLLAKDEDQLWRSTDGGVTWDTILFDLDVGGMRRLAMIDANSGFAYGKPHWLFVTDDGGLNWERIDVPDSLGMAINGICVVSTNTVFLRLGTIIDNRLLVTTDRGRTWKTEVMPDHLNGFTFVDASYGWAIGARPQGIGQLADDLIYRTTDGGATWSTQLDTAALPAFGLVDIEAISRTHARASGFRGKLYRTTDGGNHWIQEHNPLDTMTAPHIIDLEYFPSGEAYATVFLFRLLAFKQTSDVGEAERTDAPSIASVVRRGERFDVQVDAGANAIEMWDLLGRRVMRVESEGDGEIEMIAPDVAGWYYVRVVGVDGGSDSDQRVVTVRVE